MLHAKSAGYYDRLYAWKDYRAEAARVHEIVVRHKRSDGDRLLDLACGTGGHIAHLREWYSVEGLDLDPDMLAVARKKHPDVPFHEGDLASFDLGRQFDVVVCLWSSIGYVRSVARLEQALHTMRRQRLGGVVVVEPWFAPGGWAPGPRMITVDEPGLKIARVSNSSEEVGVAILDMHYLVATPEGVTHFAEHHELGLFTEEEYRQSFEAAGLEVVHDHDGFGRGLWVGIAPPA